MPRNVRNKADGDVNGDAGSDADIVASQLFECPKEIIKMCLIVGILRGRASEQERKREAEEGK